VGRPARPASTRPARAGLPPDRDRSNGFVARRPPQADGTSRYASVVPSI
jgi:hypothetical protein